MQKDLKKLENGKRPQKCLKMEDDFKKIVMGDDLKNF